MSKPQKSRGEPARPYTPSPGMAAKLAANRQGKLTPAQRSPIVAAALVTGIGLICPMSILISLVGGAIAGTEVFLSAGIFGWVLFCLFFISLLFLAAVLWVNLSMFGPETFSETPVRYEQAPLEIRMAARERPAMPFSYIIGSYSFAPFLAPSEVPMQIGREYVVYYSSRSRLLLSLAPTDQPESDEWLPQFGA